MTHKEQAYEQICRRAELFGKHINSYKAAEKQNETETRVKFIDHFFKSLGWDMDNSKCLPPHLEEVIREETISIEGSETKKDELFARHTQGRTDYTFRDKFGKPLFYLEAKKPSVDILDGDEEALQIRSYSWNTNLPIGVLTDFEELAVYDGTIPTKPNDKAAVARADYFNYKQYADRKTFDYIYDRFAQENVTHGSLREYQQTYNDRYNYRKGTKTVDEAFLESLEQWRTELAQHIVLYNDQEVFSLDEINYFVQITLNRILFLRNCEDRNIEPYKGLFICTEDVKEKNRIYANFLQICERADRRYNSGLFDLTRYNRLVYRMRIGNGTLGNLIRNTYYPVSPYRFELISPDILGTAYERFLGKTIVITNKLNAKGQPLGNTVNGIFIPSKVAAVDYKPEVRKAGGVFYTPQYVVKYIIENTIGKQIQGLTPNEVSALTFCDPACGSGSFLIGVYQYLIDWHTQYYTENATRLTKSDRLGKSEPLQGGRLTVAERKRILTNNIYGVDIDAQAVEVTKLSLLMLCLADSESPAQSSEHILPNIDANIQCGNSLIDTEFDWKKQFKAVFAKGGFDAVVGNPPYVQPIILSIEIQNILSKKYKANTDLYSMFVERTLQIVKLNNPFGFIIPSLFIKGVRYDIFRNIINENCSSFVVKEYGDNVFDKVKMPTCVIIGKIGKSTDDLFKNDNDALFSKIKTVKLGEISEIKRGLEIGRDKLLDTGYKKCIGGSNIDVYIRKGEKFITKQTLEEYSKDLNIFSAPKIMVRETGNKFFAAIDNEGVITNRSIYNTKIIDKKYTTEFILGIINSKLFYFYFKQFIAPETNIFPKIRIIQLKELPIPQKPDIKTADRITALVSQILTQKAVSKSISTLEAEIDALVYALYDLTAEEIAVVESV